jgi:hypothetical protein
VVAAAATVAAVAAAVVATAEVDMAAAATRQSPDHFVFWCATSLFLCLSSRAPLLSSSHRVFLIFEPVVLKT